MGLDRSPNSPKAALRAAQLSNFDNYESNDNSRKCQGSENFSQSAKKFTKEIYISLVEYDLVRTFWGT